MKSPQAIIHLSSSTLISFLFYGLAITCLTSATVSASNETDYLALLSFKSKITHDPNKVLTSWNHSFHFCDWSGISCGKRHKRVTILWLGSKGLEGSLSPHVGNLSFLREFGLWDNSFQGTIPHELGRLSRLRRLYLGGNKFNGVIPRNLSGCSNLRVLSLSQNKLVGSIPKEISLLSKVALLLIEGNKLTGGIPPFLGNVTSMEVFAADDNPLGGSIPDTLGLWKSLRIFYSGECNLYGSIPPSIFNLSLLGNFSLDENHLTGSLPSVIQLPNLEWLQLRSNELTGVLPPSISNCSKLGFLELSFNNFSGKLTIDFSKLRDIEYILLDENNFHGGGEADDMRFVDSLKNCTRLVTLDLRNCNLTGVLPISIGGIPPFLGNVTSMEVFAADDNPLGGSIPDTLGLWKSLRIFYSGECNLYGSIPPSIFNLSLLGNFSLDENHLTGSLPSVIQLPNLEWLQLRSNELTGVLPPSISNCSKLGFLELSFNNFSGKLTIDFSKLRDIEYILLDENNFHGGGEADDMRFVDSLKNCTRLVTLDLRNCNLTGVLPISIGNLSNQFSVLNLGDNRLFGSLPSSIGSLVGLTYLDLGINLFKGIPTTIGKLYNLQLLDLSSNQLSGPIPDAIGNLSLLIALDLDSNKLESHIPSSLGNCQKLNYLDLSHNRLGGKIPKQLLKLPALTILLNLSYNNLSSSVPSEIKDLKMLNTLDLSYNNLSGNITSSLGECISLTKLILSGNIFQGIIPSSLSSLGGLQELDLSQNNLSGKIPQFLDKWVSLNFLNLSFNDFEGEVPVVGVFSNASRFSVLGNNRLCGGLDTLKLPKCMERGSKKKRFPFIILVIVIAPTLLIVLCCLYLLYKKKRNSQPSQSSGNERFLKVSYNQLLKATDGFSTTNLIGEGGHSSVYKGILDSNNNKPVAVKVLHLQNKGAHKSFLAECEAWRNIRHRNLLKIITSCSSTDFQGNDFKALVYELMPNGSVHDWLHSSTNTSKLNLLQRINILRDVAIALDYLHNRCQTTIVHGDLKPSNVLLDDDMVAHVGDFGLARLLGSELNQNSSSGVKGTIGYTPPEYGIRSKMTSCGDVYSFGILLLEVMTGKKPTDDMFNEGLSLHKFAYMALQDRVINVIDNDAIVLQSTEANAKKVEECLAATIKIGVSCSVDSPPQRIKIENVVNELQRILDVLQDI
ncbi:serine/threonine/dual specificity protein kinase, catalytic domain-containing protein [Artemisia annua]|uniref:non-specific serine/threonine protein kinase n=1 Tax=Artemisia annua TaxID=35608 RepID=A0A2U1N5R3_ARTAN|nr:serine/threonine/dual specificity protein kinase, catalytic domain-containing protein [Artemisia annua]